MRSNRIHVFGASGVGATTLGRALASELAIPHHDADDYYWIPTNPPYKTPRPPADRLRLMQEMFLDRADWVLSGALESWGNSIIHKFDFVFFLSAPTEVRLKRLRDREERRFGSDATGQGGWRHEESSAFLDWASHYDDGIRKGRSLLGHEAWLFTLTCPVLRLDSSQPIQHLVTQAIQALAAPKSHEVFCAEQNSMSALGQKPTSR